MSQNQSKFVHKPFQTQATNWFDHQFGVKSRFSSPSLSLGCRQDTLKSSWFALSFNWQNSNCRSNSAFRSFANAGAIRFSDCLRLETHSMKASEVSSFSDVKKFALISARFWAFDCILGRHLWSIHCSERLSVFWLHPMKAMWNTSVRQGFWVLGLLWLRRFLQEDLDVTFTESLGTPLRIPLQWM